MPADSAALSGIDQLQMLVQESHREYDQIQKEMKEIDVLVRQSTAEIEKLAQRNTQIANRLRQMEPHLETMPRQDLKDAYAAAHEAQMRLFTMRTQLEQLQSRQQSLDGQGQRLRRIVELSKGILPGDLAGRHPSGAPGSQSDVVRIIEAQENERQRLARQIHDGPAQSLTNLILQAEICERLFEGDPAQARVELGNLKTAANGTFQKIREFILTLRPMMLDDLGLVPTLKQYVGDFEGKSGLTANLSIVGHETRLPAYTEVTLFRMVQELLNNVRAHAHAGHVQVALAFGDAQVAVSVEDDGSGFDAAELQAGARGRHGLGLATIHERAEMLGGKAQVESRIGRGTKVRIELPLASR
jgi:two-component system, NarL family, sensor histidine kinase DegS